MTPESAYGVVSTSTLVIAVVVCYFVSLVRRLRELERRVKVLEEKVIKLIGDDKVGGDEYDPDFWKKR